VLAQLEGFEAAAGAWESSLLPARVADYAFDWLDELCTAGRIAWARLREAPAEGRGGNAPGATPLVLAPRRDLARWARIAAGGDAQAPLLSSRAQKVLDVLHAHGASFFDDLLAESRLLRTELETALGELVARGVASCDSFAGLRALMVPAARKHPRARRRHRAMLAGIEDAGRWTPVRGARGDATDADVEHAARVLLRRYGVVSWRLLEREAPWMPRWRALLAVYRRLEARGEIRGGRFVDGLAGEQFALPEAVGLLRDVRRRDADGAVVVVSAADPLNLAGLLVGGNRVPRQRGAKVAWRDGIAVATLVAGEVAFDPSLDVRDQPGVRAALLHPVARHAVRPATADAPGG
jgi:ATP-dependent Lhr-like helicase